MAFPVDVLTNVDHETLELTAEEYMSQLSYRNTEYFSLSDSKQVRWTSILSANSPSKMGIFRE